MARTQDDRDRTARLGRSGAATAASQPRASLAERGTGGVRWLVTHPWLLILLAAAVIITIWAIGTREVSHKVYANFTEATGLVSGEDVKVDGVNAGKVTSVNYSDGHAVVGIGIQDNQYWPLHQGTHATLRFGTTIGNGTRYIDLTPGPASAPVIPEDGRISTQNTTESVEFDQIFNIFNKKTRTDFDQAMQGTGAVVSSRAKQIGSGVDASAPALDDLSGFTAELARDDQSLHDLIGNGATVTAALQQHDAQITSLVGGAAATFHAFASNTSGIQGSLSLLPPTLSQARSTLSRVDTSIGHLNDLVTALQPGAAGLKQTSMELLPVMSDLRRTIPVANQTLQIGSNASPAITRLLKTAQPFSNTAGPALTTLAPMVACLRPYSPELAGLLSTWSSWPQEVDQTGNIGRLDGYAASAGLNVNPLTPEQYVKSVPGQYYAYIRPPGYNDGNTQYDPSCGITAAGLNAADDPEAGK